MAHLVFSVAQLTSALVDTTFCAANPWLIAFLVALAAVVMAMTVLEREQRVSQMDIPAPRTRTSPARAPRRVLVVGAGQVGATLARSLEADPRYQVLGFVDDEVPEGPHEWPVLGGKAEMAQLVKRHRVDEVCVAYAPTWQQQLMDELATTPDINVRVVPSPYEALMRPLQMESFGDIALVQLARQGSMFRECFKRMFDVACAVSGLLILAPMMMLTVALIKLCMPGPAIFHQERVGRHGKTFTLYKFRTMVVNAEAMTGPTLATGKSDPRLTWLGRWLRFCRLDEVPQLWNVLRGEMSLVGPRPERPCFVDKFSAQMPSYARRHQVKPGITGLAQICGGYHTDARDKLRFDLIYVSQQSLWLDVWILTRTVIVCFFPTRH